MTFAEFYFHLLYLRYLRVVVAEAGRLQAQAEAREKRNTALGRQFPRGS